MLVLALRSCKPRTGRVDDPEGTVASLEQSKPHRVRHRNVPEHLPFLA